MKLRSLICIAGLAFVCTAFAQIQYEYSELPDYDVMSGARVLNGGRVLGVALDTPGFDTIVYSRSTGIEYRRYGFGNEKFQLSYVTNSGLVYGEIYNASLNRRTAVRFNADGSRFDYTSVSGGQHFSPWAGDDLGNVILVGIGPMGSQISIPYWANGTPRQIPSQYAHYNRMNRWGDTLIVTNDGQWKVGRISLADVPTLFSTPGNVVPGFAGLADDGGIYMYANNSQRISVFSPTGAIVGSVDSGGWATPQIRSRGRLFYNAPGGAGGGSDERVALWSPMTGTVLLDQVLTNMPTSMRLNGIESVSDDGHIITWNVATNRRVLLTPVPEPGTLTALGLGAGWLLRRRRNSK